MRVEEAPYIAVRLRPWEYTLVAQVGADRAARNHDRPDAAHYDRSRMEDDRTAQHASCAAECATARLLDKYWTAGGAWDSARHSEFRSLADVSDNIEVRRIRESTSSTFAVDEKDRKRVIVAAYVEPPELRDVRILGWIKGEEALKIGTPAKYGNRKRVPISALSLDHIEGEITRP